MQAEVIAQRPPFVFAAENPPFLKLGEDETGEEHAQGKLALALGSVAPPGHQKLTETAPPHTRGSTMYLI